jgi:hypothetical protein
MKRWLTLGAWVVIGCGGRTELNAEGEWFDTSTADAQQAPAFAPQQASTSGARDRGNLFDSEPLAPCVLGQAPPQSACGYMVDGLCYADQDAACGCACPRDRNSTCVARLFTNEWGAREVSCN